MSTVPSRGFPIGGFIQVAAIVAAVAIGFNEAPALSGTLLGAALIEVAYVSARFSQMRRVWATDRIRIVKLVLLQLVMNTIIATVFYWLGRGFARHP